MVKSFYVVSTEFRTYSSYSEFSVIPSRYQYQIVFGSSDFNQISDCVAKHNLSVENFLSSDFVAFPVTLCYFHFCEITNLD